MLCDLHVCSILRANQQRPIKHEFLRYGSACFLPRQTNLLVKVSSRHHYMFLRCVVVRYKDYPKQAISLNISVDLLSHYVNKLNDHLASDVANACFATNEVETGDASSEI